MTRAAGIYALSHNFGCAARRPFGQLVVTVIGTLPMLLSIAAWAGQDTENGEALFQTKCSACHKLPSPDNPPPEGWGKKLEQMAKLARLDDTQKNEILNYLTTHPASASASAADADNELFADNCGNCHKIDDVIKNPLTAESSRHITQHIKTATPSDSTLKEDVARLIGLLASTAEANHMSVAPPSVDASPEALFAAHCQTCHSLETVRAHLQPGSSTHMDWAHVVSRMRSKAPQLMTEEEARQIAQYLQSLDEA